MRLLGPSGLHGIVSWPPSIGWHNSVLPLHWGLVKHANIKGIYFGDDSSGLFCALNDDLLNSFVLGHLSGTVYAVSRLHVALWLNLLYLLVCFVVVLFCFCDLGRQDLNFFKKICCLGFCLSESKSQLSWLWNSLPAKDDLELLRIWPSLPKCWCYRFVLP